MEPLRIGVLGAARISEQAIVAPAAATGHRLVAVAARDRGRAEGFAELHGVERVLDSYADLVADAEVEAVYNPLANALHAPWNLAAVQAGKHVLSEKPFASDAAQAEVVRDAGRAAGVVVAEGFHYAYHPATKRLHELVSSGELGGLERVEVVMAIPAPADGDPRWSFHLAGGALMDLGCYALHALRLLAPWAGGPPEVVSARAGERAGAPGVDSWLEAELAFPAGATAAVRCDMAAPEVTMTLHVRGAAGEATVHNVALPHLDDAIDVRTERGDRVEHAGTRPTYHYQLEAFAAAVRDGAPMVSDADEAVATMTLVDACYAAAGLPPRHRVPWLDEAS